MRDFLRRVATLAAAWAIIVLGAMGLRTGGHHPGIALLSFALIGTGILIGLAAHLSMPAPPRDSNSTGRRNP